MKYNLIFMYSRLTSIIKVSILVKLHNSEHIICKLSKYININPQKNTTTSHIYGDFLTSINLKFGVSPLYNTLVLVLKGCTI